jgi:hypothetical protein
MLVADVRLRIDFPIAKTVFCFFRPHSTWIDRLHSGEERVDDERLVT